MPNIRFQVGQIVLPHGSARESLRARVTDVARYKDAPDEITIEPVAAMDKAEQRAWASDWLLRAEASIEVGPSIIVSGESVRLTANGVTTKPNPLSPLAAKLREASSMLKAIAIDLERLGGSL